MTEMTALDKVVLKGDEAFDSMILGCEAEG